MKKRTYFAAVLMAMSLTACFGPSTSGSTSSSNSQPSTEQKAYNNGDIFLTFPANWEVIQPADFTSDIPFETQVVVRNNVKNEIFTATTAVTKTNIPAGTPTTDFALSLLNKQKYGLIDYKETSRETVNINVGGQEIETYLVKFEAKEKPNDQTLRYIQKFAVKNNAGYVILGATSLQESETVVNSVGNIINSFKVN